MGIQRPNSQASNPNPRTWLDKLIFLGIVVATIFGAYSIYASSNKGLAYTILGLTIAGLIANIMQVKATFLRNALRLRFSLSWLLTILRVFSFLLLLGIIILDVKLYLILSRPATPPSVLKTPVITITPTSTATPPPTPVDTSFIPGILQATCQNLLAGQYQPIYNQFTQRLQQVMPISKIEKIYQSCVPSNPIQALTNTAAIENKYHQWGCLTRPVQIPTALGSFTAITIAGRTYLIDLAFILEGRNWKIDCWRSVG